MLSSGKNNQSIIKTVFPKCLKIYPELIEVQKEIASIPEFFDAIEESLPCYPFLAELARVEYAIYTASTSQKKLNALVPARLVNPTLQLIKVKWKNLSGYIKDINITPQLGEETLIIYCKDNHRAPVVRKAENLELVALKIVVENLDIKEVARETQISVLKVNQIIQHALAAGLILEPVSKLKRPEFFFQKAAGDLAQFESSNNFTVQWHITQACDMNCLHCYDRSQRKNVTLDLGDKCLNDLAFFSESKNVQIHVSFSGGNPFFHPDFFKLYQKAANQGFTTAILGNPVSEELIQKLISIQKPEFFQVSLEGLKAHNDHIRGQGSFDRVFEFLKVLEKNGIYSMVMLTLTHENIHQVIDLANLLKGKTDLFNFNRLAMVGSGEDLAAVEPKQYRHFLEAYQQAAQLNPVMGYKDSLFNIIQYQNAEPLFGGCTGFGCGAAFNFVAILPDGEVHACRKFPSPIGNVNQTSIEDIYNSKIAEKYRIGTISCKNCPIRASCGSCLAVSYGFQLNVFEDLDPYCFFNRAGSKS